MLQRALCQSRFVMGLRAPTTSDSLDSRVGVQLPDVQEYLIGR